MAAHTDRIGSSHPNVGLLVGPGHICMTSTENHLVACMLWKENLSYRFFSTAWDAFGKMCLALSSKSRGEFTHPESKKLEKQKSCGVVLCF